MAAPDPDSYEGKFARLEAILERLDDSQTPIDELAADVKLGAQLIVELDAKLREVETEVADAFQALETAAPKPPARSAEPGAPSQSGTPGRGAA